MPFQAELPPGLLVEAFDGMVEELPRREAARRDWVDGYFDYCAVDEQGHALRHNAATRIHAMALQWCHARKIHYSHVGPPGYGKTTVAAHFACWRIAQDLTERIVWTSNDTDVSTDNSSFCKTIVMARNYRSAFPRVRPDKYRTAALSHEIGALEAEERERRGWTMGSWFVQSPGQIPTNSLRNTARLVG